MVYITDSPETIDEAKENTLPTTLYVDSNFRNSVCGFSPSYVFDAIKFYSALLNPIYVKFKPIRIINTG